ncbi:nucleotidyltransferase domain-containing protein [Aliiroseovarius marinus]|uniref:nucleotidyltransferase domain-containing protein n=1 Tax=Aliiroseovarius marinus TaxID=2500159 RepID=UPI002490CE5B|nr:nucleotidyltransferase domain-containing protein [Aliiroseovarius marinus]
MNLSEDDHRRIVQWARQHVEIVEVYLYGSRARGDSRADSDIDLALVMRATSGSSSGFETWFDWHKSYKEAPDLKLSHEPHLEWYEADADLETVGSGVQRDGILLYRRED